MNYKLNSLWFVGIINGKGDHIFAPDDKLTREEEAVILYRAAKYAGIEIPYAKVDMFMAYKDGNGISPWALFDIYSLRILNILDDTDMNFYPKSEITNQSALTSLVKLANLIK